MATRVKKADIRPYDVVQVSQGHGWSDFSTVRTDGDAAEAKRLCDGGRFYGAAPGFAERSTFRVVRGGGKDPVYPTAR
jgi:hypothetical protein